MVTGLGMGTLAAQEDPLGDVIQPESGGLSPSDAVNPGLRAGGGARSRPSSGGWGRKRARSLSPHVVFLSGLGGPAGAPRHGRGRLLSCVHSSVPTSPGNTTPPASPEVTAHLAGHAGEHGPRFTGRAATVPIGRPSSCM